MKLENAHILVDGYNLELPFGTGIKRYAEETLQALKTLGVRTSVLLSSPWSPDPLLQEALLLENRAPSSKLSLALGAFKTLCGPLRCKRILHDAQSSQTCAPSAWRAADRLYTLPGIFRLANSLAAHRQRGIRITMPDKADLWHATAPLPIKVRKARMVTTIHDLIPLRMPWATLDNKSAYLNTLRFAVAESDMVLAESEHAKADIVNILKMPPERIAVTGLTIDTSMEEVNPDSVSSCIQSYGLQPFSYALYVGTIDTRKNIGRLLQAFNHLKSDIKLVIVGSRGAHADEELRFAEPLLLNRRLHMFGYMPRRDLEMLYRGAKAFVFPSLYEGFGLPPLEAMSLGCPVLSSNATSLTEVCGDAALYFNPLDVDDMIDKLQTTLSDDQTLSKLAKQGLVRAKFFSKDRYRELLGQAYQKALN